MFWTILQTLPVYCLYIYSDNCWEICTSKTWLWSSHIVPARISWSQRVHLYFIKDWLYSYVHASAWCGNVIAFDVYKFWNLGSFLPVKNRHSYCSYFFSSFVSSTVSCTRMLHIIPRLLVWWYEAATPRLGRGIECIDHTLHYPPWKAFMQSFTVLWSALFFIPLFYPPMKISSIYV